MEIRLGLATIIWESSGFKQAVVRPRGLPVNTYLTFAAALRKCSHVHTEFLGKNLITFAFGIFGEIRWMLSSLSFRTVKTPLSGWIFYNALQVRIESFLKELMAFLHIPHINQTPPFYGPSHMWFHPLLLIRPLQIYRHPIFIQHPGIFSTQAKNLLWVPMGWNLTRAVEWESEMDNSI